MNVERLRREEANGVPPSAADYHDAIAFDSHGFTVVNLRANSQVCSTVAWKEISKATAFKRDLFTVDCICLCLGRSDGTEILLNEDMARWTSFVGL